ncbi:hypothetical protein FRX31_019237 [Thalictrum thalictroides]|uniref:Uncharacterized protein n=1 Tax=Thalictrum thalictroides TaxID=46969 RepID=A0A7J6W4D4_THATH|nr:hypothetical protein FRX31_019237 [Thalictrum thalictroides]
MWGLDFPSKRRRIPGRFAREAWPLKTSQMPPTFTALHSIVVTQLVSGEKLGRDSKEVKCCLFLRSGRVGLPSSGSAGESPLTASPNILGREWGEGPENISFNQEIILLKMVGLS